MYRSVYDMTVRLNLKPTPGFRPKAVNAHIVLDTEGNYQRIEVHQDAEKVLCPDKGFPLKGFTGNDSAVFIVDYLPVVLYSEKFFDQVGVKEGKQNKYQKKHKNFVTQIQMAGDDIETLFPIRTFLDRYDTDQEFQKHVVEEISGCKLKGTSVLSFRIGNRNVESDESWKPWFQELFNSTKEDSNKYQYSAITGEQIIPVSKKFPQWEGGKAGSGVPMFSNSMRGYDNDLSAARSFGLSSDACPMSEEEANTVKTGLDYIVNQSNQYSDDLNITWWYESKIPVEEDVIRKTAFRWGKSEKNKKETKEEKEQRILRENREESKKYTELLKAAKEGVRPTSYCADYKYHIVHLTFPDKGRMMSGMEYEDTYQSLADHLNRWYLDTEIETSFYDTEKKKTIYYSRPIQNIYEILYALKIQSDGEHPRNQMYQKEKLQLLEAVYRGGEIPEKFINLASEQYTRYVCQYVDDPANDKYVSSTNARCILNLEKVFLLRKGDYTMDKVLTPSNESVGYQCGRWMAAVDKLQEDYLKSSDKNVNKTLSSRFYKLAKKSPAKAFSLVNDYIKIYEEGLSKNKPGAEIRFSRLFGEISEMIGAYYPDRLSIAEQGAFDLGFAQQKQAFYKKAEKKQDANEEVTV